MWEAAYRNAIARRVVNRVFGGIETGGWFHHDGPMKVLTILELRQYFSRLIRRVEAGEELLVSRYGVPVARLVPIDRGPKRTIGGDVGEYIVPADFNSISPASTSSDSDAESGQ